MSAAVELLDICKARSVDRFVLDHPNGSPFHETRWTELVRATFGFATQTLVAWRGRDVVGVLPLAMVTAPITGRRLVSVPFGVYGGILTLDEDVTPVLDDAAKRLAHQSGARFLELRYLGSGPTDHAGVHKHETYRRGLPEDPADCLGLLPRKARAEARKGRDRHGLKLEAGESWFGAFYDLYVTNKRGLGSPVFRPSYFRRLLDLYGPRAMLHAVVGEDGPLAAVLSLEAGGVLYPYYSGAADGIHKLGANNFMYVALMEEAVRRGCRMFDFGRSRIDSGPAKFKQHMGFEATPLDYQFYFPRGGRPPEITPGNPRMALPQRILSSIPSWMARAVGPAVMRHVP